MRHAWSIVEQKERQQLHALRVVDERRQARHRDGEVRRLRGVERLRPGDVLFLDAESDRNAMQIGVCLVFEGAPISGSGRLAPDPDALTGLLEARLRPLPRARQRLASTPIEGRPVWIHDRDFDLRRHLRYARLETDGDDAALRDRCAEFLSEPLDLAHPLWMILVLEGLADDRFALVVKAHHCLADGVAGIEILRALLGPSPQASHALRSTAPREAAPSGLERILAEAIDRVGDLSALGRQALDAARRPREFAEQLVDRSISRSIGFLRILELSRTPASPTVLDVAVGTKRSLEWIETDLARIREIQRRRGGTVNDIVVGTLAIALGRHLDASGIPREEQASMVVRVAIPVNRRAPRERGPIGNQIALIFAALPIAEIDPLVALDKTRVVLAAAKASHTSDALDLVLELAAWTPRRLTRALTRLAATRLRPANLVVTNVPGPAQPLELLGAPLLAAYPIVPLMPGHALTIAVLSYAGRLFWTFHADPDAIPDLKSWSMAVQRAFEDLHEAALRG